MYKVVHVQKDLFSAGRAAMRLHNAFIGAGIDSSVLSLFIDINDTDKIRSTSKASRIIARVDYSLQSVLTRKIDHRFGLYSFPLLGTDISGHPLIVNAEIIYLHWVQGGFMNLSGYHKLVKLGKPVIIFMHDMWTITGGCHHSFDCDKYKNECSDCPAFEGKERIDWVKREFRRKGKIYKNHENLCFVTPSNWLFGCTTNAALTINKPVFRIPNIVDENIYKSVNRRFARQLLNLDPEEIIVAFGAFTISSPYKGWTELEKALNLLHESRDLNNLSVLIFGGEYNKVLAESIPFKTRFLGFLKDEYSTVLVYNAADVFVSPSLADNLPTTILECLACGTPVTGFDIGGIPDMIDHKKNGYLAKYRDPVDLAEGIRYCINNKIQGRLLPEFKKENIIARHLDLLHNLKGQ